MARTCDCHYCWSGVPPLWCRAQADESLRTCVREDVRIIANNSNIAWLMCVSHNAYFVDLFVRKSNSVAINMYKKLGYSVYRTVTNYYSGEEDAFGTYWSLREWWWWWSSQINAQIWGKHCRAMCTRNPSNRWTEQWCLTNWTRRCDRHSQRNKRSFADISGGH